MEVRFRSASYLPIENTIVFMNKYIIEEKEHLSPVVVGTTVVLIATFGIGLLYQLLSLAL